MRVDLTALSGTLAAAATSEPASTPTPTPTPAVTNLVDEVIAEGECAVADPTLCGIVHDLTGSERAGAWASVVLGTPFKIVLILVVAFLVRKLVHRAIIRVTDRMAAGIVPSRLAGGRRAMAWLEGSPLASERRVQRAQTMGSVLRSVTTGVVATVALLMVLSEVGLDVAPLLASAGILGVALGFGSQALVRDFLSGIFMIVEDQYGVGDVVDLGEASGAVEAVGLRVTRVRDVNGTVWYVRNGEILRVGNQSQGWARAVLDIGVAYGEDVLRVQDLLRDVAHELRDDPDWTALVLEEPEVWGVEALSADSVVVRLVVKTMPLEQWRVARELRRRIKTAFDEAGVEIPFPQRTVWMRQDAAALPHQRPRGPGAGRRRRRRVVAGGGRRGERDPFHERCRRRGQADRCGADARRTASRPRPAGSAPRRAASARPAAGSASRSRRVRRTSSGRPTPPASPACSGSSGCGRGRRGVRLAA